MMKATKSLETHCGSEETVLSSHAATATGALKTTVPRQLLRRESSCGTGDPPTVGGRPRPPCRGPSWTCLRVSEYETDSKLIFDERVNSIKTTVIDWVRI